MAKKIRTRTTTKTKAATKKSSTDNDVKPQAQETVISEGCEPLDIVDLEALRETTEALSIAGCTVAEKTLVSVGESLTSAFSQGMEAVIQSTEEVLFPKLADLEDEKQKREGQSILRAEQEVMVDRMRDEEAKKQKMQKEHQQQQKATNEILPHQNILDEVASFSTSDRSSAQKRAQSMPARTNISPKRVFSFAAGGAFNPSALASSLGWTTKVTPPPPPEEPATPPLTPESTTGGGGPVYETLAPIYVAKPQKLQPGVSVVQQQPVKSSQSSSKSCTSTDNKASKQDNNNLKYWRATYDYTTNKTYYFNKKTKETSWARPPGFVLTPETVKLQKKPIEQPKKRGGLPRLKIFNR